MPTVLEPALVTRILDAGQWTKTADDTIKHERLPEELVHDLVKHHRDQPNDSAALANLGLLVVTMAAGRWGVKWTSPNPPPDTAHMIWAGPDRVAAGKHVMSYTIGGIGLPHLDTGSAQDFFQELIRREPGAEPDLKQFTSGFVYDAIRNEQGKRWETLKTWCLTGLRRFDIQKWILEYWVDHYWLPAYEAVMKDPNGTLEEAFVVSRIWNTSKGAGLAALAAAKGKKTPAERIAAELATYPKKDRYGVMQRPGAVYKFIQ
jgi:hypothetical protein